MNGCKIDIPRVSKLVSGCYNGFEDVWVGYNRDTDKIDVVCSVSAPKITQDIYNSLKTKVAVNISKQYGTRFVEDHFDISIINFL